MAAVTEGLLIDFIQGVNDIKNANKQPVFKQSIQVMYGLFQKFGYRLGLLGSQYGLIAQVISTITSVSHISLEVNRGEIVTLFGEVGSGKSTLIQIIQKHYLPESGEIIFNGKSITEYSTPLWREYAGVVNQHVKIFNGNVFENICLGNYIEEIETIIRFLENGTCRIFHYL